MTLTDLESIQASLGALNAAIIALIESHPDRAALSKQMKAAERMTDDMLLDSRVPDRVIQKTLEQIAIYQGHVDKSAQ